MRTNKQTARQTKPRARRKHAHRKKHPHGKHAHRNKNKRTEQKNTRAERNTRAQKKNNSPRTPMNQTSSKAKATLAIGEQNDPGAIRGVLTTDAPTVQRISIMIFLWICCHSGRIETLVCGDVSSIFFQGESPGGREPLYMEQPRGTALPGLHPEQLVEIVKGAFGLPGAPRT